MAKDAPTVAPPSTVAAAADEVKDAAPTGSPPTAVAAAADEAEDAPSKRNGKNARAAPFKRNAKNARAKLTMAPFPPSSDSDESAYILSSDSSESAAFVGRPLEQANRPPFS